MSNKNEVAGRRSVLQAGLGLLAAGSATAAMAGRAAAQVKLAQEKLAQELVQYRATPNPDAPASICSSCVNWVAPNACNIVAGEIHPNGWCVAYAPKNG